MFREFEQLQRHQNPVRFQKVCIFLVPGGNKFHLDPGKYTLSGTLLGFDAFEAVQIP